MYKIELSYKAQRDIALLDRSTQKRLIEKMERLGENPHPSGHKKLVGLPGLFRVRVGHWRIVYSITESKKLIIIDSIGHRSDIYKRLRR